jgi:hypothetical protein
MIDRRRVVFMIESRKLGVIAAWLAGTEIAFDKPHPVFVLTLREKHWPDEDSD